jgi:prepilin-type N-terminal cleavage/methylation domain-containing protein
MGAACASAFVGTWWGGLRAFLSPPHCGVCVRLGERGKRGTDMRSRYRTGCQRGVTLVELLIAIIIATVAFAALVPLFVLAQKSNSSDKARIEAVNIAQAKMELIRELDFAQVDSTTPHPSSPTADPTSSDFIPKYLGNPYDPKTDPNRSFHNGDFAPTYTEMAAAGPKVFWIKYTVTSMNAAVKRVSVEVGWNGNPKPLKTAVLQTLIYGQWGGPRIDFFDVETHNEQGLIDVGPVSLGKATLKAVIDAADAPRTTGVTFSITSRQGTVVPVANGTKDPSDLSGRTWYLEWSTVGVGDALYTFTAVAYAVDAKGNTEEGNTWRRAYRIETGPPADITHLIATPGDGRVLLTWDASTAGDLAHYEVRAIEKALFDPRFDAENQGVPVDDVTAPLCLAVNLENYTPYLFFVRPVDERDNKGDWASVEQTPDRVHLIPPAPPSNLWVSVVGSSVTLNWTASPDAAFYKIYKWTDAGATPTGYKPTATTQTISLGYSATGYYQVRAVDAWGNEQQSWCTLRATPTITPSTLLGGILWATATTPPPPRYYMSLYNTLKADAVVKVTWLKDGPGTLPADEVTVVPSVTVPKQDNSPSKAYPIGYETTGWYRIYWSYSVRGSSGGGNNTYDLITSDPIGIPVQ